MNRLGTFWFLTFLLSSNTVQADEFGDFVGHVRVEWCDDGRNMRLLDNFAYKDPSNVTWDAPKDAVIDGASIPHAFWSLVGGPFEGRYRNASVVHDIACEKRNRPWKQVHRMFYNACRRGKVSKKKALVMYGAVYHGGPRWDSGSTAQKPKECLKGADDQEGAGTEDQMEPATIFHSDDDFFRMRAYLEKNTDATPEDVERLTPESLRTLVGNSFVRDCSPLEIEPD